MNLQITNHKLQTNQNQQTQITKTRKFDLEERTLRFAMKVIHLSKSVPQDFVNIRILGQLINSSGSIGANYREANEALSKKDFLHKLKISRKECKESSYWLELLKGANPDHSGNIDPLIQESIELRSIFTAIITKVG
jgi:four helix bundle protein